MNEIYDVWGNLHNYFMPQMKLISKDRVGAKVIKKYDNYPYIIEPPFNYPQVWHDFVDIF